jgi:transcriptional regulator with XRE-family HTH domain
MNSIEALKRDIESALSGVETKLRKPRKETGHWWLDAMYNGHVVTVEWSPRRGFGISTDDEEGGYGEGPDEVFTDRAAATTRVIELLVKGTRSVPPQDVVLRELRAAFGFTQEQLANRLGVQQAAVSRMERRSDITLSSLRRYVEALGGRLEITVRTPGGEHLRLLDPGEQVKARAMCEHVAETLPGAADSSEPETGLDRLGEMVERLENAARARWRFRAQRPLLIQRTRAVDLAWADLEQGSISINTEAVARLTSLLPSMISRFRVLRPAAASARDAVYRYVLGHEVGHFVQHEWLLASTCEAHVDRELHADGIAGWLAGLAGDEPAVGSMIASVFGCRASGCSHPTPEQRMLAFLSGHSQGLGESTRSSTRMTLLVLRVADLEVSRAFYAGLGLELVAEQHGNGPLHYSCTMEQTVMELYPCTERSPRSSRLRFGFQARKDAIDRLCSSGFLKERPRVIRSLPQSKVYLVRDPDENSIELEVAA